jgi:hypothetical protein
MKIIVPPWSLPMRHALARHAAGTRDVSVVRPPGTEAANDLPRSSAAPSCLRLRPPWTAVTSGRSWGHTARRHTAAY